MTDDPQEKSHQMVALSPDEHGGNHAVSESDPLATNQEPEEDHTTIDKIER